MKQASLKIEVTCTSEMLVNFNGFHGFTSQKIELFEDISLRLKINTPEQNV
jgi:hypothetical protein